MDPLSLSASVAGLVALADLVFRSGAKYIKAAKNAKMEVHSLLEEVKNISILLHHLSLVAFRLESEYDENSAPEGPSPLQPYQLHECEALLGRLKAALEVKKGGLDSGSLVASIHQRLKWPFSTSDIKEILADIQRHKQTIGLAVAAESMNQLRICLKKQEDTNARVRRIEKMTQQNQDTQIKISMDKNRRKVLEFFTKVNPRSEYDTNKRLRHPLTGLWLTEGSEFEEWYTTSGSKTWFTGIPGAGKSVLASAVISECFQRNAGDAKKAVAYFFCTYRDERTHKIENILSSLAIQLALQSEDAYQILKEYHDEIRSDGDLPGELAISQLFEILANVFVIYEDIYLIIDGLDECTETMLTCTRRLQSLVSTPDAALVHMALFSRDEFQIRSQIDQQFQCMELQAHTEDIQRYVAFEIESRTSSGSLKVRNMKLKDDIMTELISGSKGMFRWVACQLDHLCELPSDRARREALHKLPPTLPATYERILLRVESYPEDIKQKVQRTLHLISSRHPLSITQICQALSLSDDIDRLTEDDIVEEDEILHFCGSLVRKSDQRLEYAHYTVQEFLKNPNPNNPSLGRYKISQQSTDRLLGALCLQYINLQNYEWTFDMDHKWTNSLIEERRQTGFLSAFYEHAAMYWPEYLQETRHGDDCIMNHLSSLFDVRKTARFCNWAIEFIRHCRLKQAEFWFRPSTPAENKQTDIGSIIEHIIRPDFTPLHMAAALELTDVCEVLLKKGTKVELRSRYGTPLQYAVGSLAIFVGYQTLALFSYSLGQTLLKFLKGSDRQKTVELLLHAGAELNLQVVTPEIISDILYLFFSSPIDGEDFRTLSAILNGGIALTDGDIPCFEGYYGHIKASWPIGKFGDKAIWEEAIESLLQTLQRLTRKSELYSKLYSVTFDFAVDVNPDFVKSITRPWPQEDADEEEVREFIASLIEHNDIDNIKVISEGKHSTLIQSIGFKSYEPGYTAIHIAVNQKSLDALSLLLDLGCSPSRASDNALTPLHLCRNDDKDIAKLLLTHGASSLSRNSANETIWHTSSSLGCDIILHTLLEFDEKTDALIMVSDTNETPICAAINNGNLYSTRALLPHCDSKECWRSGTPLFRAAAGLGSDDVVQKLIQVGVDKDVIDEHEGNPLHFLSAESSLQCIETLKNLFPFDQRRSKDMKIPFELILIQALECKLSLHIDVIKALLPESMSSNPAQAAILWLNICLDIFPVTLESDTDVRWLIQAIDHLITLGVPRLYEEEKKESSALPLLRSFSDSLAKTRQNRLFKAKESGDWNISPDPELVEGWGEASQVVMMVARDTDKWPSIKLHPSVSTILIEAIFHDDSELIHLWLEKGVSVHNTSTEVSPLELACMPQTELSQRNFNLILSHAEEEKKNIGNEALGGCGLLHLTAYGRRFKTPTWKAEALLQGGVDCNLPGTERIIAPIIYHLKCNSPKIAELLLEHGADPWTTHHNMLDVPLAAIQFRNISILNKLLQLHGPKGSITTWGRTWEAFIEGDVFSGGNALHYTAYTDNADALKFYLENGILTDLEAVDDFHQTPMNYAARFGSLTTLRYLASKGANIDSKSNLGFTPLHEAVIMNHISVVEALLELGAKQLVTSSGMAPINYAYQKGNRRCAEILERYQYRSQIEDPTYLHSPRNMAQGLARAIEKEDIDTCRNLIELGCPIDIELNPPISVTPLMHAIITKTSAEVVEWLIENGAMVSTVFSPLVQGKFTTALDAAAATRHPSLSLLTRKYFEEGGIFRLNTTIPLHHAIFSGNIQGVEAILKSIMEWQEREEIRLSNNGPAITSASMSENASTKLINYQGYTHETCLHVAAVRNQPTAVNMLAKSGANINILDAYGRTPLIAASSNNSTEAVEALLSLGADPNVYDIHGDNALMWAAQRGAWGIFQSLAQRSPQDRPCDCFGTGPLGKGVSHHRRGSDGDAGPQPPFLNGVDLHQVNHGGMSAAHYLFTNPFSRCLGEILSRDAGILRLDEFNWPNPMPWAGFQYQVTVPKNITNNIYLIRRYLTQNELRNVADLANPGKHSILCDSARFGWTEAISNFLKIGADLEHPCEAHGTPLVAAALRGHLKTVQYLVRQGAAVPCTANLGLTHITVNAGYQEIVRWLLVERYTKQTRLTYEAVSNELRTVAHWSGSAIAKVPLKWEWKQRRTESILSYAARRKRIMLGLRGEVVSTV